MPKSAQEILNKLAGHKEKIKAFGVRRLGLFGSWARGESKATSDLDFIVEFNRKTFDGYMDLKAFLEGLFDCQIDLVIDEAVKPRLRSFILKDVIHAPGL